MVRGWPVAEWWARACLPGALRPQPVMPHVRHATTLTRMLHTAKGTQHARAKRDKHGGTEDGRYDGRLSQESSPRYSGEYETTARHRRHTCTSQGTTHAPHAYILTTAAPLDGHGDVLQNQVMVHQGGVGAGGEGRLHGLLFLFFLLLLLPAASPISLSRSLPRRYSRGGGTSRSWSHRLAAGIRCPDSTAPQE